MSQDKDLLKERFREIQEYLKIARGEGSWISSAFVTCLIFLIFAAIYFFVTDTDPLLNNFVPATSIASQANIIAIQEIENSYVLLGTHANKLYSYHKGTGHLYIYDIATGVEDQGIELRNMTPIAWHDSGKALFIASVGRTLNSTYLLDLTVQDAEPVLLIDRQQNAKVSSNLQIDESSLIKWSTDGTLVAFTMFDVDTKRQWLFISTTTNQPELIFTPAQEMDRISSLSWVDQTLYFVAAKDGLESRYQISSTGGNFKVQPKG